MVAHVHEALAQVKRIREHVIERQKFRGYSGVARIIGGVISLVSASIFALVLPPDPAAHFIGWGLVFALSISSSVGALLFWFLSRRTEGRRFPILRPVLDTFPAIIAGGIITNWLWLSDNYDSMPGVWMIIFGVLNTAVRHSTAREVWYVGWGYIAIGALFLAYPMGFVNPWPMGATFFVGELLGGYFMKIDSEQWS